MLIMGQNSQNMNLMKLCVRNEIENKAFVGIFLKTQIAYELYAYALSLFTLWFLF